jgi:hypothetical protein
MFKVVTNVFSAKCNSAKAPCLILPPKLFYQSYAATSTYEDYLRITIEDIDDSFYCVASLLACLCRRCGGEISFNHLLLIARAWNLKKFLTKK